MTEQHRQDAIDGIIKYTTEHGEVINYTLDSVPSHYKDTGILPNSVAGEEGNHSGISQ